MALASLAPRVLSRAGLSPGGHLAHAVEAPVGNVALHVGQAEGERPLVPAALWTRNSDPLTPRTTPRRGEAEVSITLF